MTDQSNNQTSSPMLELAERCEKATGPDRDLDGMIGAVVGCEFHSAQAVHDYAHDAHGWGCEVPQWAGTADSLGVLKFTASLDAAMTLVPEEWVVRDLGQTTKGWAVFLSHSHAPGPTSADRAHSGDVATPALALCAAALRARAAISEPTP